jgi:hypothetical protein
VRDEPARQRELAQELLRGEVEVALRAAGLPVRDDLRARDARVQEREVPVLALRALVAACGAVRTRLDGAGLARELVVSAALVSGYVRVIAVFAADAACAGRLVAAFAVVTAREQVRTVVALSFTAKLFFCGAVAR